MAKSETVTTSLRRMLDSGDYPVGSRLQPERLLSEEFGVSRTVLRTSLAQLEAEGRLWRNVGQGTFVGGRPVKSGNGVVLASALTSPAEVMEVRMLIEPHGAFMAAGRATQDDIHHLEHCLSKLEGSPNHANYSRWDSTLHRAILEAAHNSLLLMLFDAVNEVRHQSSWSDSWMRMLTPNRDVFAKQHRQIIRAILDHDPFRAQEAMHNHLETVRGAILSPPKPKAAPSRKALARNAASGLHGR
jgi:DNA-binding FadR family transcriptional regulator